MEKERFVQVVEGLPGMLAVSFLIDVLGAV